MTNGKDTTTLYQEYVQALQEVADIKYAVAVLQWDQETYMPAGGAEARGRQIATLSEIAHVRFTAPAMGNLLAELSQRHDLNQEQRKNIELSLYDYNQQTRLPSAFVRQMSETVSRSFHDWIEARKANDFRVFQDVLGELVELKKKEADLLGYTGHPYNALLNQYERGATTNLLDSVFGKLQPELKAILDQLGAASQVDDHLVKQHYPASAQWDFGMELLEKMGYDFNHGRQDRAEHPFTINFCSKDVRITTRIDENDLANMTWSTIHELGHALYEQGLPEEQYGLPLGEYASLSIHESQSRLWENNVGRSIYWCRHFLPLLQRYFPNRLGNATPETLYRAINKVSPSLIRTEADELTYHFHVIIRYELEKALINGDISVKDIPAFWNEHYRLYLGVAVPDDRQGCLQDVHWSHGSFGYFPTYSLGSLYAAQFYSFAEQEIPGLHQQLEAGQFSALKDWLKGKIHIHGRKFTSEELCREICGEGLNIQYFMQYAKAKYRYIYSV